MLNRREACAVLGGTILGLPFSGHGIQAKENNQLKYHAPEGSILVIENLNYYSNSEIISAINRFLGNDNYYKEVVITHKEYDKLVKNGYNYLHVWISNRNDIYSYFSHKEHLNNFFLNVKHKIRRHTNIYGFKNYKNKEILFQDNNLVANYYDFGEQVLTGG